MKTKTIEFTVKLTFDEGVDFKDFDNIRETAGNIVAALQNHVDHSEAGLAPESSNTFTRTIEVIHPKGGTTSKKF